MGCNFGREEINADDSNNLPKVDFREPVEMLEHSMGFNKPTIRQIDIAFLSDPQMDNSSILTKKQIVTALAVLNIDMEEADKSDSFNAFFKAFDYGDDQYDMVQILTALYLLSKSPSEEKAITLYNLYHASKEDANNGNNNNNDEEDINDYEIHTTIHRICECVYEYSSSLLKIDAEDKAAHEESLRQEAIVLEYGPEVIGGVEGGQTRWLIMPSLGVVRSMSLSLSLSLSFPFGSHPTPELLCSELHPQWPSQPLSLSIRGDTGAGIRADTTIFTLAFP